MSEYTAEDFKDARFAEHRHGAKAVRWEMNYRVPWHTAIGDRFSDEQMAENGWAPVVEADGPVVTEGTLRHVEARAERKRQKLIAHIASVEAALRDRNRVIEDLRHDLAVERKERDRLAHDLRRSLGHPKGDNSITLDALEVAWESAEVPTADAPIREGDVVIEKISASAYAVMSPPPTCGLVGREFRILPRAPREPWQDLADLLGHDVSAKQAEQMARRLHMVGVRVTGGDDDE